LISNNHASASSPVLDSPSKVAGLIFLNSPSRWSVSFLFLSGMVLSSTEGVPSDEMSHFSGFAPEFLEALLITSSSWLSSFGLFLVTILRIRTSFISCCSYCAFFNFSFSALKTCSSTIRFLIVSNTSVGELPSLFSLGSPGCGIHFFDIFGFGISRFTNTWCINTTEKENPKCEK
jgi:hypothetical protein